MSSQNAQLTIPVTVLAINSIPDLSAASVCTNPEQANSTTDVILTTPKPIVCSPEEAPLPQQVPTANSPTEVNPVFGNSLSDVVDDSWADLVKGSTKQLKRKGTSYTLDSGEACVKIPNSAIERHRKSWECFILG